jgi:ribosomal protein S27E
MEENTKRFLGVILYPLSAGMIAAMNILDQTVLPNSFGAWFSSLSFFGLDLSSLPWAFLQGNELFFTIHAFCLGLVFICLFFGDIDWFYLLIILIGNAVPNLLVWTNVVTQAALSKIMPYTEFIYSNPEAALAFILLPIPFSLLMAFTGFNMFTPFVWWHTRSETRKRHIRRYPEMYWDVKKLEGVGEVHAKALYNEGVKTVDDILKANIKKLSKATGIDSKMIWHWRDAAELLSVECIDATQAELLVRAGINGIYELSIKRPGAIYAKYNRIANRLGIEQISKGTANRWKVIARDIRKGKYKPEYNEHQVEKIQCKDCGNDIHIKTGKRPLSFRCPSCGKDIELK